MTTAVKTATACKNFINSKWDESKSPRVAFDFYTDRKRESSIYD